MLLGSQSEPSKYSKVNNTDNLIIFTFTLGQSLAESVDHESQSTVVATTVDTATATVATAKLMYSQLLLILHYLLLLPPLLLLLLILLLQKSVLELHNPLLHHSHLHYQLRVRMRNQLNQKASHTLFTHMGQLNDLFSPIGFIFIPGLNILWSVTQCIVSLAAFFEVM